MKKEKEKRKAKQTKKKWGVKGEQEWEEGRTIK